MTDQAFIELVKELNSKQDMLPAIFGMIGVVAGSLISFLGQLSIEYFKNRNKNKIDKLRMKLLIELLEDERYNWKDINTLSSVIGASKNETRDLLIQIGARGSTNHMDFEEMWGLISKNPLNKTKKD